MGTLTISNTSTLAEGSFTAIEIDKTAGTYDSVRGMSTVTLAGSLAIMASLQRDLAARNHLARRRLTQPWPGTTSAVTSPRA